MDIFPPTDVVDLNVRPETILQSQNASFCGSFFYASRVERKPVPWPPDCTLNTTALSCIDGKSASTEIWLEEMTERKEASGQITSRWPAIRPRTAPHQESL